MVFYVYILRINCQSENQKYLTMITENLEKNLRNFFNYKKKNICIKDISLKYCESYKSRKEAIRRKKYIRNLSTKQKKGLIQLNTIKMKEFEHIFLDNCAN